MALQWFPNTRTWENCQSHQSCPLCDSYCVLYLCLYIKFSFPFKSHFILFEKHINSINRYNFLYFSSALFLGKKRCQQSPKFRLSGQLNDPWPYPNGEHTTYGNSRPLQVVSFHYQNSVSWMNLEITHTFVLQYLLLRNIIFTVGCQTWILYEKPLYCILISHIFYDSVTPDISLLPSSSCGILGNADICSSTNLSVVDASSKF